MKTFKDTQDRSWEICINVASLKRVRTMLGIDLPSLWEDGMKPLAKLLGNACDLVDVLYVLVKPEADRRGVTDEQFGSAFKGDVLDAAEDAFMQEFIDFFPKAKATNLRKITTEARKLMEMIQDRTVQALEKIDTATLEKQLLNSLGVAPESAESSPGPSP